MLRAYGEIPWRPPLLSVIAVAVALLIPFARPALQPQSGDATARPKQPCVWTLLGPLDVPAGEGYDGSRVSVSGRVSALAVDPSDPETVYVGSALGGVWKSRDGGRTWSPMSDNEASLAVGALAVDSTRPGTIYVGTGEANLALRQQVVLGDRALTGHRGRGVLKSADGGETWRLLGRTKFSGGAFAEMAVSRPRPTTLLAATTLGLFLSRDGSETWSRQLEGLPLEGAQAMATSVALNPAHASRAYAAFWGGGVFRSDDFETDRPQWKRLTRGFPLSNVGRIGLSISEVAPNTLFALVANVEGGLRGLYVSHDAGDSWTRVHSAPDVLQRQGFFNLTVAAHPLRPGVVFIGGAGNRQTHPSSLYRGTFEDGIWQFVPLGSHIHIDVHALSFHPRDPETLYVGTDGGVWKTTDGGKNWVACNKGLITIQFNSIAQHPESAAFIVGGTQDNGTLLFNGAPAWGHSDDGDGGFVAVDQSNPTVVYNEFSLYKIARSDKAAAYGSFVPIYPKIRSPRSAFFAPFAIDPESSQRLAIGIDRVYVTQDSGESWGPITSILPGGPASRLHTNAISALLYARSDLIYAGTSDGKVWRLSRQPGGWFANELSEQSSGAPTGRGFVTDLALAAGNPDLLYVAFNNYDGVSLWHCRIARRKAGKISCMWSRANGSTPRALPTGPLFAVELDHLDSSVVYAGTEDGVYRSLNAGGSWERFSEGLPRTTVYDLQLHPKLPLLRAATHGRGVWERDISGAACQAVELYVRDNELDDGRSREVSALRPDVPGHALDSPSIKVVPRHQMSGGIDFSSFHSKLQESPIERGTLYKLHALVGNRGPQIARHVRVRFFLSQNALPTSMPQGVINNADGGKWQLLGETFLDAVSQSMPGIATFDWTPAAGTAETAYLLIIVDALTDPVSQDAQNTNTNSDLLEDRHFAVKVLRLKPVTN